MSDIATLQAKIAELAQAREEFAQAKLVTDLIKGDIDQLKLEILAELQRHKLKTLKGETLAVTRTEKPSVRIIAPDQVLDWIDEQGQDAAGYTQINTVMAQGLIAKLYKETGEIPPGAEIQMTEYIQLKEVTT